MDTVAKLIAALAENLPSTRKPVPAARRCGAREISQ